MKCMDEVILDILGCLEGGATLDAASLDKIIRKHSKRLHDGRRIIAKKRILPYYLDVKAHDHERFASWNVSSELDEAFVKALKMKPRRTASGVATITVITKPCKCANNCIYCPCDIRMPKSYLHDEPACQRAERNFFDPYLQVASRLKALQHMGHATDKVELIVLGGSWTDYPRAYRIWYVKELFRALNDTDAKREGEIARIVGSYDDAHLQREPDALATSCADLQRRIDEGRLTYNAAYDARYGSDDGWNRVASWQTARPEELHAEHETNVTADHRVVGLVVETRPDALDVTSLKELRELGCTKIQMGIQSLDENIVMLNGRTFRKGAVEQALALSRLFGFKTHVHYMLNLLGSMPEADKASYAVLASQPAYLPDEVKLYPCALVEGTKLVEHFRNGTWRPYSEDELLDVLCADMIATPPFTRVSRMIRDISANDIMTGNKKTNLRQLVEQRLNETNADVSEIRFREIGTSDVRLDDVHLDEMMYRTTVSEEHFLQWVTPENKIVGFLRLSLPDATVVERLADELPITLGEAMIREVHVYGFAAKLFSGGEAAQHHGLGRALVERACAIARAEGYERMNVISAVGTRDYYRKLGFSDNGLYQQRRL